MDEFDKQEILVSKEDASVNFVLKGNFPGFAEARYVRRKPEYFIAYLSSQTGCKQACRFCHLTATGQTDLINLSVPAILEQANTVMDYYENQVLLKADVIHYSFMARGEPLANPSVTDPQFKLMEKLAEHATAHDLLPKIMISTILPNEIKGSSLVKMFPVVHPNIYYSIYSMDQKFRKKWLPKAMSAEDGLSMLKDYQDHTNKIIRLHWAFIEGENDRPHDVKAIIDAVNKINLRVDVNIVRYNPYSDQHGREPEFDRIKELGYRLTEGLPHSKIKIVDRVGRDVYASCGTFYPKEEQ